MGLEDFIHEFVGLVSVVKRPVVVNKKNEKFYLSLTPKPTVVTASFEEISSSFKGTAYLYTYTLDGDTVKFDYSSESILNAGPDANLLDLLFKMEFYPVDLSVKNVVMASPADGAGIKKGDILLKLDNQALKSFEELRLYLQKLEDGKAVDIVYLSNGIEVKKNVIPQVKEIDKKKTKLIGLESAVEYLPPKLVVAKAESFGASLVGAFSRTWDGIVKTFGGYKKLITREVSLNNIGGPLAIGKVASDSFNISLSMFFRLMAIISINLGVINLFPIPVLDGGHIMFLVFEAINRGPLSKRKLEIAQRFGLSILFLLLFVALFNDFSRLF